MLNAENYVDSAPCWFSTMLYHTLQTCFIFTWYYSYVSQIACYCHSFFAGVWWWDGVEDDSNLRRGGWWGHYYAGYTRDLVFYELQVVTNLVFTSGSDLATLNGNANISFIRHRNEAFFDASERIQWKLSFGFGPSFRNFVDQSIWPWQNAASSIFGQVSLVSCWP
jgi:hypothetical protein